MPAGISCRRLLFHAVKEGAAGFGDLTVGEVEVAGIPRVGDFTGAAGEVEEAADLVVFVRSDYPFEVAEIVIIHYDDVVVMFIFRPCYLVGAVAFARDALFM